MTLTPPHPDTRTQLRPAAFFDLDRTMVAGSSGAAILVEMYHEGILGRRALVRESSIAVRFRLWGIDDDTTDAVLARIAGYVTGVHHSRLDAVTANALERIQPRVFPSIVGRVRAHQQAGERVYLVTASSQEFAEAFAATLDLDGAIGSRSEIVDGRYTGRPGGPFVYGEGKVTAITALAAAEGLDLSASVAYSDSISDLPMLRAVGRPVAVNPDKELRKIAEEEGWEILAVDHLAKRLRAAAAATAGVGVAALATRLLRPRLGR
ncbi:MAG: HAD family hydrolase [Solirubrobacteraceae bacterium]|nr:HAD family hydrolase [Solirubrobacteraceae bacterium]